MIENYKSGFENSTTGQLCGEERPDERYSFGTTLTITRKQRRKRAEAVFICPVNRD